MRFSTVSGIVILLAVSSPVLASPASGRGAWGAAANGYQTRLIAGSRTFVVGKPMRFALLLKNLTCRARSYDDQSLAQGSFRITGPSGAAVLYKQHPFQTMAMGSNKRLGAGKTVTLFANRDITLQYVIAKTGVYTIQLLGKRYGAGRDSWFPASNKLRFQVRSGRPKTDDRLMLALASAVPKQSCRGPSSTKAGWWYTRARWKAAAAPSAGVSPLGRTQVKGVRASLICFGTKRRTATIQLWLTRQSAKIAASSTATQLSQYVGKGPSGHLYIVSSPRALSLWPTHRAALAKTLKIPPRCNAPSPRP